MQNFLCPIVNRRKRLLEIQSRRVKSIKRGVHILTRKKDIRRLCVHRVYEERKGSERSSRRLKWNKTKEARMRKTFFGDICRVLLVSCVGPCFWSGWSWPTGFFKGCPQLEPVLFPYRTGLSTGTRCSISEQRQKKNGRQRERERETEKEKEGIPVLSAFGHFRWLTFSPEPINVFTQYAVRILDFFFFFNHRFFLNYRQL